MPQPLLSNYCLTWYTTSSLRGIASEKRSDQTFVVGTVSHNMNGLSTILVQLLFANKNVMVNSRIKLSGYEKEDSTDNERDKETKGPYAG